MKTKTQYFKLPGNFTLNSSFLVKFDGQYSYWGNGSRKWIRDSTLSKQFYNENNFILITEREVKKIIKDGDPPNSEYRRENPKIPFKFSSKSSR